MANIDFERLCNTLGITEGLAEEFAKQECVPTLVRDIHTYVNYDEIAMDASDKGLCMKESKEFYGERILNAIETIFYGKNQEEIALALSDIQ